MKKLTILILILCVFAACSKTTEFDNYMRSGKDAMKIGKYEEAIKNFKLALIEKPTDEDAAILRNQSMSELLAKQTKEASELLEQQTKEALPRYQDENSSIYTAYKKIWLSVSLEGTKVNKDLIKESEAELRNVYGDAVDLERKYDEYPKIKEAHDDFIKALDSYISAFEQMEKHLNEKPSDSGLSSASDFRTNQYLRMHDDYIAAYTKKISALRE